MGLSAELLFQKLGKQLRILDLKGQEHPFRRQPPAEIILLHQTGNRRFLVVRHREYFIVLIQQIAAAEMEHREAGLRLRLSVPDDVGIRQRSSGDQLFLAQGFYRIQPVP